MGRTGRNSPCPCGSGKKYKRCCGAPGISADAPQRVEQITKQSPDQPTTPSSSWVWWSTLESVERETPSVMAILETIIVVGVVWWLALKYDFVRPLIISSAFVAPLVLLRSPDSDALGAKWLIKLEEKISNVLRPARLICGIELFYLYDGLGRALLTVLVGAGTLWLMILFPDSQSSHSSWGPTSVIFLALLIRNGFDVYDTWGTSEITYILAPLVIAVALTGVLYLLHPIYPRVYPIALTVAGAVLFTITFGIGLWVLAVAFSIRVISTFFFLNRGLTHIPQNFRRLVLCTSPLHEPELVPGLSRFTERFRFRSLEKRYRTELKGDWLDLFSGRKLFGSLLMIWFAPAWLYRITLKSTSWLWWPLSVLSSPPTLSRNPEWFHAQIMDTKWAKHVRPLAYASVLSFVGVSVYRTLEQGRLPDNPFLSVIGYAFWIDWAATPWQLLGLTGSLLTLVIIYSTDWSFRKYRIGKDTNDPVLSQQAIRHLSWIERLSRARTVIFLTYCGIVGFHAILVLNARSCWFLPAPSVQSWSQTLYGERVPRMECGVQALGADKLFLSLSDQLEEIAFRSTKRL